MTATTPFSLETNIAERILTVAVLGTLDLTTESLLVDTVAERIAGAGCVSLTIDASGIDFIDSSGLRALLRCAEAAERESLSMKLVPNSAVSRLLQAAGIEEWFRYE